MKFLFTITFVLGTLLFLVPQLLYAICALSGKIMAFRVAYRPFLYTSFILLAAWVLLMAYGYFVGRMRYEVKEVQLSFATLPPSFHGYRIVHISDLHLDGLHGNVHFLEKIVTQINDLHPDAICFTGDLVSLSPHEVDAFASILQRLTATDGVFAVLGNHDYMPYAQYADERLRSEAVHSLVDKERALGWKLLLNESCLVSRGNDTIAFVGVENQSCGAHTVVRRGKLLDACSGVGDAFTILLSHDPSHWRAEVLPLTHIPLTLSGHTHAMQFRIGGFTPSSWLYPECDGLYAHGNRYLYVNIGLSGTLPCRVGATPEVTLIELLKE